MPKLIKIRAAAKINLCLDILGKDPSGYHEIQTVFQEIPEIFDEVIIEAAEKHDDLSIIHNLKSPSLKAAGQAKNQPADSTLLTPPPKNLAFLALQLLKKIYKIKKFAYITIKKNIPLSSGLGGASSDAAAVLKGLNKLWNLKLSTEKLLTLAAKLGMDVPFFIIGGTALGTHFGEKITPLPPLKGIKFKIFPKSAISQNLPFSKTALAYASLDISLCGKNTAKTQALIEILTKPRPAFQALTLLFHNDFETLPTYKNLPPRHHLSGSGPSTFDVTQPDTI